jgi:cytochrome c oxidase subunit 1
VVFSFFAAFYYWYPKMFGRRLNEVLGHLHFWPTLVFFNLTFLPMFVLGFAGHHRRIANPQFFEALRDPALVRMQWLATVGAVGMLGAQIPFLVNLVWSALRGAPAGENPWRANTLEWTTPSPPPHGNFAGPPIVYRGPYEYSVPGRSEDWWPQTLAPERGAGA